MKHIKLICRIVIVGLICILGCSQIAKCNEIVKKDKENHTLSNNNYETTVTATKTETMEVPQFDCSHLGGAANCTAAYVLDGPIDNKSATSLILWLLAAEMQGVRNAVIQLDTNGGELLAGQEIMLHIENSSLTVSCVGDFSVASMGFSILQSCDHRYMTRRTYLMSHEISLGRLGMEDVNGVKLDNVNNELKAAQNAYNEHIIHRMKITMNEYLMKVSGGRNWFLDWKLALKYGAVDKVVDSVKEVIGASLVGKPVQ